MEVPSAAMRREVFARVTHLATGLCCDYPLHAVVSTHDHGGYAVRPATLPPFLAPWDAFAELGLGLSGSLPEYERSPSLQPWPPAAVLCKPLKKVSDLLATKDVYQWMRGTRVMFSFGSRRGGLDLAVKLRNALLTKWAGGASQGAAQGGRSEGEKAAVYIDMENLKTHKDTKIVDGKSSNPHWAEFYYMGLLTMSTFVLMLDSAWQTSWFCEGEWALFLRNAMCTYRAHTTGQTRKAFDFKVVAVYDVGTSQGGGQDQDEEAIRESVRQTLDELNFPRELWQTVVLIPARYEGEANRAQSELVDGGQEKFEEACGYDAWRSEGGTGGRQPGEVTPLANEADTEETVCYLYEKYYAPLALQLLGMQPWWTDHGGAPSLT
jgi:hypothetical protein